MRPEHDQRSTAERFPPGGRALGRPGDEVHATIGLRFEDCNGIRLGHVEAILVGRRYGENRFVLVRERFGRRRPVPVDGLLIGQRRVCTPYTRADIHRAPCVVGDGAVSLKLEEELCAVYGLPAPAPVGRGWERRASVAPATVDPADPGRIRWVPGPREAPEPADQRQQRSVTASATGRLAPDRRPLADVGRPQPRRPPTGG